VSRKKISFWMTSVANPLIRYKETGPMAPFFFVCLLLLLGGCSSPETPYQFSGPTMGTSYHVTLIATEVPDGLEQQIAEVLEDINQQMSTYQDDSLLMQFNRTAIGDPFDLSADLMNVLMLADTIYRQTGGAFDPTVGPTGQFMGLWA
jgi:Membrane-associated lipoprotein involved in thiamine biosynthesis